MVALPRHKPLATHPELVWVQRKRFTGWACSACAWEFNPSDIPPGNTIAEMKLIYERERDKAFESHDCAEHPRAPRPNPAGGHGLKENT